MKNDDLQRKIMEAGVVPESAVKQMEQWRAVPQGSADNVKETPDLKKVRSLRSDLELRGLPSIREALPDLKKIMSRARPVTLKIDDTVLDVDLVGVDRLDRYIFAIPAELPIYTALSRALRPMTELIDTARASLDMHRRIMSVSLIYTDEVPSHWFCETEAEGKTTLIKGR